MATIKTLLSKMIDKINDIPAPTTASVGQALVVNAVDKTGKPTGWNAIDLPEVGGIIDVLELPTVDISENCFYRLMTACFVNGEDIVSNGTVYCVDKLPEIGEIVSDTSFSYFIAYYNVQDNEVYGYVDAALGSVFGIPAGWYTFTTLASVAGLGFNGVVTDIDDSPSNNYFTILLDYDFYVYKNDWKKIPFAYEKQPEFDIQWNGVIGDRFALDLTSLGFPNVYFVKISDEVFTVEQLIGAKYTMASGYEHTIIDSSIDATMYAGALNIDSSVIVAYSAEDTNAALGLPSGYLTNGVYFYYYRPDVNNYTNRLVAPTKITKIPSKFIDLNDGDGLAVVATTGNYNDLYNRPTIYTDVVRYNYHQNLTSTQQNTVRSQISVYSKSEVDSKIANAIGNAIGGSY